MIVFHTSEQTPIRFDTDDGISRTETGQFVENGPGQKQWQVRGSYQYFDPNQQLFRVNYVADTNGYVPTIEKMPELLPTTTPQAPITLSPFRTAEGVFTEAPAVAEDEEEGGGLLDDRLAPNLVKSLVG